MSKAIHALTPAQPTPEMGPSQRAQRGAYRAGTTVSVVIPAYNEERNLARLVRQVMDEPWSETVALDAVIVVDDYSDDQTPAIADGLADAFERVRAIHHVERSGKNAGIRTGAAASASSIIVFVDADVSLGAHCLTRVVQRLADNPTLMAASCIGEPVPARSWRERASRFQLLYVAELSRRGQGTLNRVYAIRSALLKAIELPDGTYDDLYIARWLPNHDYRFAVQVNAMAYVRGAVGLRDFAKQTVRNWRAGETLERVLPPTVSALPTDPTKLKHWKQARTRALTRAIMREPVGFPLYLLWRMIAALMPTSYWLPTLDHSKHDVSQSTKDLGL